MLCTIPIGQYPSNTTCWMASHQTLPPLAKGLDHRTKQHCTVNKQTTPTTLLQHCIDPLGNKTLIQQINTISTYNNSLTLSCLLQEIFSALLPDISRHHLVFQALSEQDKAVCPDLGSVDHCFVDLLGTESPLAAYSEEYDNNN